MDISQSMKARMDSWDRVPAQIENAQASTARPAATTYMKSTAGFTADLEAEVLKARAAERLRRLGDQIEERCKGWKRATAAELLCCTLAALS